MTRALKRNTLRVKREHFIHFIHPVTSLLHQGFYSKATSSLLSFIVSLIYSWKKRDRQRKKIWRRRRRAVQQKEYAILVGFSFTRTLFVFFIQTKRKEQGLRLMFLDFLFLVSSWFSVSCVVLIAWHSIRFVDPCPGQWELQSDAQSIETPDFKTRRMKEDWQESRVHPSSVFVTTTGKTNN